MNPTRYGPIPIDNLPKGTQDLVEMLSSSTTLPFGLCSKAGWYKVRTMSGQLPI